jgi:hypothetical protein
MTFVLQPVVTADAQRMATVKMSAWRGNQDFQFRWKDSPSLDKLISHSCARIPWNLINRRAEKRHLKAIDVETGELVGYARWLLPPILADRNVWPEAAVAEPAQRSVNSLKRMIEPRKSMTQCLKKRQMVW